jgi:hypothetical protein
MAYLNFLFSGGEQRVYKDVEDIERDFERLTNLREVMSKPKAQRDKIPKIIWNLFGIDSRSSGPRVQAAAEGLTDEEKNFIGVANRLEPMKDSYGRPKKGEELQEALRKNQEVWDFTLKRAPLIALKGILQFDPDLQREINKEVFGNEKVDPAQIEAVEDWLLILKEKAVRELKPELDYSLVPVQETYEYLDEDKQKRSFVLKREDVRRYVEAIRKKVWEKDYKGGRLLGGSLEDFEKKPDRIVKSEYLVDTEEDLKKIFPFTIAVSDLPLERLEFIRTGHIWNIGRRWRDIMGAKKAQDAFMVGFLPELPRLKKVEDYKRAMKPIYDGLNEIAHPLAQEFMGYMARMISLANQKLPHYQWMPAPLEKLVDVFGFFENPHSYAQTLFGPEAACWDRINIRRWIEGLAEENYINSLGEGEINQKEVLLKDLHAQRREVIAEFAIRWGPLAIFLILAFLANELKKQLEEELKKAG